MFIIKILVEVYLVYVFYVIVIKINNGNFLYLDKIYLFYVVLKFVYYDFIFNLLFSYINIVY